MRYWVFVTDEQHPPTSEPEAKVPAPVDAIVLDWQSLPKSICKGLVIAQAKATTVDNDGKVSGVSKSTGKAHGFTFPTAAAIACRAREAMEAGGLAIMCTGWAPRHGGNGLQSDWILVSEGEVSPTITVAIPMAAGSDPIKSLGATMSYTRKYLLASLLNMGWNDPREEVETMNEKPQRRGGGGGGQHHEPPRVAERTTTKLKPQQPQQPPTPNPQDAPGASLRFPVGVPVEPAPDPTPGLPIEHENPQLREGLAAVRQIFAEGKFAPESFWKIATGLDRMPLTAEAVRLPGHVLKACTLARRHMTSCEEGNCAPERWTHQTYIAACEANEFTFTMINGAATQAGVEYDKSIQETTDDDEKN